jgi:predicted Zn-dependent protease
MISRRHFTIGLCSCATGLTSGCIATTDDGRPIHEIASVPTNYSPERNDTEEAGIWLQMQKDEEKTKRSVVRIKNAKLDAFIDDLSCRIGGQYCGDMRKYIMRIPAFNATMAPNGMMSIWTGLMLRCKTESQLAAVIGHEFGHYLRRHSYQRIVDIKARADFIAVLSIGVAAAGLPPALTDLASLGMTGGIYAFSRDNEREADTIGLEKLADAGYDPFEAAEVWRRLTKESAASGKEKTRDVFTATHPDPLERIETLEAAARRRGKPIIPPPDRLQAALEDIRLDLLLDEIKKNKHEQTLALFDILMEDGYRKGETLFAKGELFRHRNKKDDTDSAIKFYQEALADSFAPPDTHRSLGLIYHKAGRKDEAATHIRRYLNLKPNAVDKQMLLSYIGSV